LIFRDRPFVMLRRKGYQGRSPWLVGLCSKEACKELHTIKDIRNEFAHKGLTRDFNSQRVRDLANNLTFGKKWKITIAEIGKEDDAEPG
jgi:hypothetical protein